jgi:hypothetical protein
MQVSNWFSIVTVVEFMRLFVPDITISLKVKPLLLTPLISIACLLLLLFMMHNCLCIITVENIGSEVLILYICIFILQPLPPSGMGSSCNVTWGIMSCYLTGENADKCE